MDYSYLNDLFDIALYSKKEKEDIGKMAPCYEKKSEVPLYEECFALEFLKWIDDEYKNIEFHDNQMKTDSKKKTMANSMDLVCRDIRLGIEVVQAINDEFREEESCWNKQVCNGTSTELIHEWENQPTSMETIQKRIEDKNQKYDEYLKKYDYVDDIDLFVYIVDARIKESKFNSICGLGCPANEILSEIGLRPLLKELKTPYKRIYIIFENYWYCLDRDNDYKAGNNILRPVKLKEIYNKAIELQKSYKK